MANDIPVTEHLKELRHVFFVSAIAILVSALLCYGLLREPIMNVVTAPLSDYNIDLKFTGIAEAFMAYMKVSVLAGCILASPIVLWQLLKFILPGLYRNEKRAFLSILFWCVTLFVLGILFAYFVVISVALKALLFSFSGDFEPFITVGNYLSFVWKFILPFGIVFEIPVLAYFLTYFKLVTSGSLKKYRRYVIVIIVVLAGVFSPPDVFSQIMLAGPMYVLYEISIIISRWVESRAQKKASSQERANTTEE